MAQKALFVTVDDIKKKSIIDGMVDEDKIIPFIEIAQDKHIHDLLGTDLYDKLQADIIADSLAGDYLTLINDYIKPVLIWYSQVEYLPFSDVKIGNAGVLIKNPEGSDPAHHTKLHRMIKRVGDNADHYADILVRHLCNNSTTYPEYLSNSGEDKRPNRDPNYCNWVL
jgi:hypothetical protein